MEETGVLEKVNLSGFCYLALNQVPNLTSSAVEDVARSSDPTVALHASVRHTEAFSGVVQRDATIHQSIAAKVATGFELGNSLDQERVTATRRTAQSNSASCLDRIDGAANQAQGIGAK
jgi:hypothetical protein